MKVVYYVKIIRDFNSEGVILSFPSLPAIQSINCNSIDVAILTAKRVLTTFCQNEEFLPLPITYIGEEYYSIHMNIN